MDTGFIFHHVPRFLRLTLQRFLCTPVTAKLSGETLLKFVPDLVRITTLPLLR
jgi:hypothetical protein